MIKKKCDHPREYCTPVPINRPDDNVKCYWCRKCREYFMVEKKVVPIVSSN